MAVRNRRETYHVERELLLHHAGVFRLAKLSVRHTLTLERSRLLGSKVAPLLLPFIIFDSLLFFGGLAVELVNCAIECVFVGANAVEVSKSRDELLLCFQVGFGERAVVGERRHVGRAADEWILDIVAVALASFVVESFQVHSVRKGWRPDNVLAFLVLVIGQVSRLESTRRLVRNLQLALLLVQVPYRLLRSFTGLDVVVSVVALHPNIVLVLEEFFFLLDAVDTGDAVDMGVFVQILLNICFDELTGVDVSHIFCSSFPRLRLWSLWLGFRLASRRPLGLGLHSLRLLVAASDLLLLRQCVLCR